MAGTPIRRARREAEAKARYEGLAKTQEPVTYDDSIEYSPELNNEICELLSIGTPIDDVHINSAMVGQGIASRIGVSPATIYRWQREHEDFKKAVQEARDEFCNRIMDKKLALADLALSDPAMANAVRVAGQELEAVMNARRGKNPSGGSWAQFLERLAKETGADERAKAERRAEPEAAES